MNLVVSDASPIHYLILVDAIEALPKLFQRVIVPEYVISQELQRPSTPSKVRTWISNLPPWVDVRRPSNAQSLKLDRGEEDAIALALEFRAPILLDLGSPIRARIIVANQL